MNLKDSNRRASFNDLQVQRAVREQKQKELAEKVAKEEEEKKQERAEEIEDFKNTSLRLSQINKFLLISIIYCIVFTIISLLNGLFLTGISCIICAIFTLFIGKVSYQKNEDRKLTNTLLWNLSQSLFDFIDLKIPYDVFPNKDRLLATFTFFGILVYTIFPSSNVFYGITTAMIIVSYLVSFAMKDVESIHRFVKPMITALFIGLFTKPILYYVLIGTLEFDAMNMILLNIFTIIRIYTEKIAIYHQ